MKSRSFITALAFMAFSVMISAQTTGQANNPAGQGNAKGAAWVDANNDGICDNYASGSRQGRGPGQGQCQAAGTERGPGKGQGKGQGQGLHNGHGKGEGAASGNGQGRYNGRGPAFVDANNDGVCDNLAAATKK